jgi:hypothetical protein
MVPCQRSDHFPRYQLRGGGRPSPVRLLNRDGLAGEMTIGFDPATVGTGGETRHRFVSKRLIPTLS